MQHGFQHSPELASPDQRDVQRREDVRMRSRCVAQAAPGLDPACDVAQRAA
jgi:hypothetical protein